jgi:SAM-dependent methyltransferase
MHAFGADIRNLSCESNSIDVVVSLSTLDHFDTAEDITIALAELYRVLKPGGTLIVTLDNRANPVVALRNRLPYRLTHRLGLVPYPVGITYRPGELRDAVASAGFVMDDFTTILHAPRVLAIPVLNALDNSRAGGIQSAMLRAMIAFEHLGVLPSREITGHFTAVRAMKPMRMRLQLERERGGV